jgi:ABC-2 type transport system ATP-binding protein
MFGSTLHVTSRDAARLDATVAEFRPDARYRWQRIEAGLEDVFISLMNQAARQSLQ